MVTAAKGLESMFLSKWSRVRLLLGNQRDFFPRFRTSVINDPSDLLITLVLVTKQPSLIP